MIEVCTYCINRIREPCEECKREGKYRYLEPETLPNWELPPDLPSMRELVDRPAMERLAILWLAIKYQELEKTKGEV